MRLTDDREWAQTPHAGEHISVASVPYGCFLHHPSHRKFLICVKQTADLLAWLAQKAPRKTHSLGGVEQTAHPRPSQALHLLRDMHSLREWKIEN